MAHGGGNVIGCARVSTGEQNPQLQPDALQAAGAVRIFTDTITGTSTSRPQLDACLDYLQPGNVLAVWRVDRLGRSVPHLIDTVAALGERGWAYDAVHWPAHTAGVVTSPSPVGHGWLGRGSCAFDTLHAPISRKANACARS